MKYRLKTGISALCMAIVLSNTMIVNADNDYTINSGESMTIVSNGASGAETNGNSNINTNTSTGSSHQASRAEINAHTEKKNVRDQLYDWMDDAMTNANGVGMGSNTGGDSVIQMGITRVPEDAIANLLGHVNAFDSNVGIGDAYADWYNVQSASNGSLPLKQLDDCNNLGDLPPGLLNRIKEAMAENEGLRYQALVRSLWNLKGFNQNNFHLSFNPSVNPNIAFDYFLPGYALDYPGVRPDLIAGGLNDSSDWSDRFKGLERFTSNSMEDYCSMVYLEEYHISSVQEDYINVIDYTSDTRRWTIYKDDVQVGEPMITNNPQHEFTFTNPEPGRYKIVAEQEATYESGVFVRYDICTYFFDAETRNLLYFKEETVSNGKGGSVLLDGTRETGFVPTGDYFYITVNDLGEIETDGSLTQRIE